MTCLSPKNGQRQVHPPNLTGLPVILLDSGRRCMAHAQEYKKCMQGYLAHKKTPTPLGPP